MGGELELVGAIVATQRVPGEVNESIFQPEWSPKGVVFCIRPLWLVEPVSLAAQQGERCARGSRVWRAAMGI